VSRSSGVACSVTSQQLCPSGMHNFPDQRHVLCSNSNGGLVPEPDEPCRSPAGGGLRLAGVETVTGTPIRCMDHHSKRGVVKVAATSLQTSTFPLAECFCPVEGFPFTRGTG
jgi:hypothetical protein